VSDVQQSIILPNVRDLTSIERALVHRVSTYGPSALLDAGYSPEDIQIFLDRAEVKQEIALLASEYKNQSTLTLLTQFMAKRQMMRLMPDAVGVLESGLQGHVYSRDADGNVLLDEHGRPVIQSPEITRTQLNAAQTILDRLGIDPQDKRGEHVDVDITVLFTKIEEAQVEIVLNPDFENSEQKGLSREKIRTFIELIKDKLPEARKRLEAELNTVTEVTKRKRGESTTTRKKKKKKKGKKVQKR